MWLRPQIKKQELLYWVQGIVVIFFMLTAVALFVSDRASYLDRLFSLHVIVPVYLFALLICLGAYRCWPADTNKANESRT